MFDYKSPLLQKYKNRFTWAKHCGLCRMNCTVLCEDQNRADNLPAQSVLRDSCYPSLHECNLYVCTSSVVLPAVLVSLQVDLVCHGKTDVFLDKDGSDPYAVSTGSQGSQDLILGHLFISTSFSEVVALRVCCWFQYPTQIDKARTLESAFSFICTSKYFPTSRPLILN